MDATCVRKDENMESIVYYFSGTGNSLAIAKKLAEKLKCKIYPINELSNEANTQINRKIVVVFPVYLSQAYGIPIIIKDNLELLKNINNKIVIGICTCGGFKLVNAVPALCNLRKVIKSNKIGYFDGYSIKLPMNNLEYPSPFIDQDQQKMFFYSEKEIDGIYRNLLNGKQSIKFFFQIIFNFFMKPLYVLLGNIYANHVFKMAKLPKNKKNSYLESVHLTDRSIEINQNCNGCGVCVKVCPANNIELKNNKPIFLSKCEMCMACDEWCPNNSIHHWCRTKRLKYHHPEITINDMIKNSI